jgi:hypothetical protein
MLAYMDIDYDEKLYTQEDMGGNLPQMPFFTDKTGKTIGDSLAILAHLSGDYRPELSGKSEEDKQLIEIMKKFCEDLNSFLCQYCYGKQQEQPLEDMIQLKVSPLTSNLRGQGGNLILGSKMCYLDFYLYEIT